MSGWSELPVEVAIFAIQILAIVVYSISLTLSFFSKWTYRGKTDTQMAIILPFSILALLLSSIFETAGRAIELSDSTIFSWKHFGLFFIYFFDAFFYFTFKICFLIALPRMIMQQLEKTCGSGHNKSLGIFAGISWLVLTSLEGAQIWIGIYLFWVYLYDDIPYFTDFSAHTLSLDQMRLAFAYSILTVMYILVLIGFASKLSRRLSGEAQNILVLLVILPIFLIRMIVEAIYYGIKLFPTTANITAITQTSDMLDIIAFSVIFLCMSIVGFINRSRIRKAQIFPQEQFLAPQQFSKEPN